MEVPCVYVDFNALPSARAMSGSAQVAMEITGYGTLRSLARQRLHLAEGMALLLFEPNDIQCHATAHFEPLLTDPAGRVGAWVALLDPGSIEDCALPEEVGIGHPCASCRNDLVPYLREVGQRYTEHCPTCGTSVMAPMEPPRDET